MQLHSIKPVHENKESMAVGRGGKRGKTSGRGTKGQNARAGRKKRPELRDIIKKLPKLRGYRFKSIEVPAVAVSLPLLAKHFAKGEVVSPRSLAQKGLIVLVSGKTPRVKLLGKEVSIALTVEGCECSVGAKSAIETAGGSVK
jgi:large subunit ribosomal protein L15